MSALGVDPAVAAERPTTLHDRVLDVLGPAIAAGDLPPGAVLTLDRIETRFEVSRTVAREAVRVLESMGLATGRRRVGISVQPRERWNVFDRRVVRWRLAGRGRQEQLRSLTALRAAVEPPASAAAAHHATAEQREQLADLAAAMTVSGEAGDLDTFLEQDIAFHGLVLRGSGNEMFAALADVVAEVLTGRTVNRLMPARPRPEALEGHRAVAAAVVAGEADAARDAMQEIVAEVLARRGLPDREPPPGVDVRG
ncbi:FadR/GntR family transcriptional regulator [Pseudonocardia sp. MH-G8]|uniref:FadR/GntR family transcriptional regulator n=1 Tax=Pseudonocardia sp. MH-G8 TaxID=1854588 RepID=UPI000BA07955|nr:FCD domain-containing protein [Pseudonocardia sp. MH-G8]OZM83038.1 GntR family transcriptional regulator [Pseudonocardia sp. MH-G8]